jgi:hypothetical protein
MLKKFIYLFKEKKIFSSLSILNILTAFSKYILLFLLMIYSIYIMKDNIILYLILTLISGFLYNFISNSIKYSNNKFISFLQDCLIISFIILFITIIFIYVSLIDFDIGEYIQIIRCDGKDVDTLAKEVSNGISNNKISVELTKKL